MLPETEGCLVVVRDTDHGTAMSGRQGGRNDGLLPVPTGSLPLGRINDQAWASRERGFGSGLNKPASVLSWQPTQCRACILSEQRRSRNSTSLRSHLSCPILRKSLGKHYRGVSKLLTRTHRAPLIGPQHRPAVDICVYATALSSLTAAYGGTLSVYLVPFSVIIR